MKDTFKLFIEKMKLRGMASATIESYSREVRRFFNRHAKGKLLHLINDNDIHAYFLHLIEERDYSPSAIKVAYCGLKFFLKRH